MKLPLRGQGACGEEARVPRRRAVASSVPAPSAEGRRSSRGHLAAGWLDALYAEGPYARKKRVKTLGALELFLFIGGLSLIGA